MEKETRRMQRQLARFSSLILLLCLSCGVPGHAQKSSSARQKLSMAAPSATVGLSAPPAVRIPASGSRSIAAQTGRIKKLSASSYPQSHWQKGLYYKQKGQTAEALLEFIQASVENPRDLRAFYEQAQLFKQQGNIKLAKSSLEQALAISPTNTQARSFLVQLHFESGNLLGAAAEVGKMLTMSPPPAQNNPSRTELESNRVPAGTPAIQTGIPKGGNTAEPDETSVWLRQAAGREEPARAAQPNQSLNDVLSMIGAGTDSSRQNNNPADRRTEEAKTKAQALAAANQPVASASVEAAAARAATAGQIVCAEAPAGRGSLLSSVRSSASHAMTGFTRPVPAWLRNRLPLAAPGDEKTAAKDNAGESRTQRAVGWVKAKVPFAPGRQTAVPTAAAPKKESRTQAITAWIKEKNPFAAPAKDAGAMQPETGSKGRISSLLSGVRERLPFGQNPAGNPAKEAKPKSQPVLQMARNLKQRIPFMHAKSPEPRAQVVKTFTVNSAGEKKNDLPPEIARILEGKSNPQTAAPAKATETESGQSEKDRQLNQQIRQVLASLPAPAAQKETQLPVASGPDYGLLKNNALAHVSTSDPPEPPEAQPSALDRFMTEAGKTFSGLIPKVNWNWPQLPAIPHLKKQSDSPLSVIAAVPALKPAAHAPLAPAPSAAAPAKAVPLDVSRILNKLSTPATPKEEPLATRLSASLPVAGAPAAIDELIPRPPAKAAETPTPQALPPSPSVTGPLSTPATPPQNLIVQAAPVIASVISQTQPLLKPTVDAASAVVNTIAPIVVPKTTGAALPQPVQPSSPDKAQTQAGSDASKSFPGLAAIARFFHPVAPAAPVAAAVKAPPPQASRALPCAAPLPPTMAPTLAVSAPALPVVSRTVNVASPAPVPASMPASGDRSLPQPVLPAVTASPLPTMSPQALAASHASGTLAPQSSPQSVPQALMIQVPSIVQSAIDQAQPVLKPALEAGANLAQAIAPLAVPKSNAQAQPVESSWAANVANAVPMPVTADMQKYFPDISVMPSTPPPVAATEELAPGAARKLVEIKKTRAGAFTYMKPVIDTDRAYLLGGRQVRTIQPLSKPQEPKKAPEEDAITRRMRYLLEHGTGNLRRGEAFMFSEETGEGTLFLPDGTSERRRLQDPQEAEKVMRQRRPDIMGPKDIQYTLSLLGKLLPPQQQQQQQNGDGSAAPVSGPTLEQLMNQMNQSSKGFFGWIKKSFNMNN
jgi:tetratricopeptide (TPR) repeat protein